MIDVDLLSRNKRFPNLAQMKMSAWCNQPQFFKKTSFEEYCTLQQKDMKNNRVCSALGSLNLLKEDAPQIYEKYCKCKYEWGGNKEE